jgi:hypothetical protein
MPGTYPAAGPSLTGDLLTISRLLQSPAAIGRRLRDFRDLRFISDQILTQRTGVAAVAQIVKWGQKVALTDEEINRSVYAGQALNRSLRKVVNTIIKQVDTVTLSAVASAVTATQAASAVWSTTSNILVDVLNAKAVIVGLNLGYMPDTLLLSDAKYAILMGNDKVTNAWARETTNNPVYTGEVQRLAGLNIIVSPNLPTADPWVIDSQQLGGMADERDAAPGYAVSDMGIEVLSDRITNKDKWDLQGRRKTVPVVQEPGAAVRITGT